ncbi:MAG: hypothetical protein ABL983_24880 [Nitrospira sp.]
MFVWPVWLVSFLERDKPVGGLVGVTRQVRAILATARPATNEEKANEQGHSEENPATYSIVTPSSEK